MKKDIEWFKKEFDEVIESGKQSNPSSIWDMVINTTLKHIEENFKNLINQLDEPEVLSQKWIDEHRKSYTMEDSVEVSELQNLLVPKQELPVIPKYVADWIVSHREKFDLYPALKGLEGNPFGWERTYEWYRVNTQKFVNAFLTGEYEVEEEPKYHALIKGHELVHDDDVYWNYDKSNHDVFVSRLHPPLDNFTTEMSKAEWNKLGINDSNADLVKVNDD